MSAHRIGVIFSAPTDRKLLVSFLQSDGYRCWAPTGVDQAEAELADEVLDLSLLLVEERVAARLAPHLFEERARCECFLPMLVTLKQGAASASWLRRGFDDVLRLPIGHDELRARLNVMLRHQERSVASLEMANRALRRKNRELDEARQAADRANRAKTEFMANVSHELRTPLHGILGCVEILKQRPHETEQLDLVEVSGRSLLGLVEDLLDFASLEAGRFRIQIQPVLLEKQLESVLAPCREKALGKGIDFRFDLDPAIPQYVLTDPLRFSQVASNLVGNAIKFTDVGYVRLSLGWSGVGIEMEIEDTGIGIPDEQQELVFLPFHQADGSTTRCHEGTGLGLAIVSRIVAVMEGTIAMESAVGEGTRFRVVLPVQEATPPGDPEAEESMEERSLAVLVVEDNPISSKVMQRMLEVWGHSADIAESGATALERVEQRPYDVILMDLQMPRMSGLQTTRAIREKEQQSGRAPVPILALTARSGEDDREICLRSGMNEYLTKPPDHRHLRKLLLTLTERKSPEVSLEADEECA